MTGYRTIVFNLIMGLAGIIGLQIAPDTAQHWAVIGVVIWMVGGVLLRFLTTTPAFKTLPPEVQKVADEIAASVPSGEALLSAVDAALATDAPGAGGATITGPPPNLIDLATSISNALATVQAVHAQVTSALQAGKDAVGAALPAAGIVQPQDSLHPQPAASPAGQQ